MMADPGGDVLTVEQPSMSGQSGSEKEGNVDGSKKYDKHKKHNNNKKQQHNKKWKGGKFKRYKQRQQNNKAEANQTSEGPQVSVNTQNRKHGHCHVKPPYNKRIQQAFSTVSKFFLPEKLPRKARVIPPTKFLLGGNISDPLNLNSLQNESENAVTPKSSPIPTPPHGRQPVEVLIPPNIRDPLHLLDPVDSVEYEMQLCSPMKRKTNKNRHRKRRKSCKENNNGDVPEHSGSFANTSTKSDPGKIIHNTTIDTSTASISINSSIEGDVPSTSNVSAEPERSHVAKNLRLELGIPETTVGGRKRRCSESSTTGKGKQRRVDLDKIVSPVIPQHNNTWKRPHKSTSKPTRNRTRSYSRSTSEDQSKTSTSATLTEQMKIDENAQGMSPATTNVTENASESTVEEQSESHASETTRTETKNKSAKYQYGNYDRYYGYRHLNEFMDVRLKVFLKNPQLFKDKDVLDIGCNVGLLTIEAGKSLHPKSIIGLDIDKNLINRARKNLSMYVRVDRDKTGHDESLGKDEPETGKKRRNSRRYHRRNSRYDKFKHRQEMSNDTKAHFFPMSFPLCLGRIPKFVDIEETSNPDDSVTSHFPDNVFFRAANYVPKDENQLISETQQYDLILCLSVTKWIHLNFGDAGLKMAFKRMFNQLRPGGKLILEAQNWASYKKKKNVSETVKENYAAIRFFPKKFNEYLLSSEVGFSHSYPLGIPRHLNKGFSRPIQLFVKGEFTPSHAQWSDYHMRSTPYQTPKSDPQKNKYYTNLLYGNSTPIVIPLLSIVAMLTAIHYWQQRTRFVKMGNKLPGPPPLPFIGNSHLILGKSNHEIMNLALKLSQEYGDVGRGWLGNNLVVALTHPNDIEKILNSNVHIQKSDEYRFFKPWLGNGLLISSGDKWRNDRKLIAPAFHMNVLKSFVNIFNSNSLAVVDKMRKEVGRVFDVHDYMSEVTVDILLETAMGTSKTAQNKDGFEYAMAVMKMCDIIHQRHYKLYYRSDALFNMTSLKDKQEKLLNVIHGLTKKVLNIKKTEFDKNAKEGKMPSPSLSEVINETKETSPKKNCSKNKKTGLRDDLDDQDEDDIGEKRRLAFLDLMIETAHNGANLTETDIKEQVDTIMFEGHDTTAAGSSFVLCLLAIHQDIQERVMEEQFRIFGNSKRQATYNDTLEMKYLERVIFETLRMYPPVPIIARKVTEDIQLDTDNHVIPAGCTVIIGTFVVHRRPDYYPNPDKFDPDNFLPERTSNRHYYSFIPFSAGPRSCVGRKYAVLKLKILLSTILRNYRVKSSLTEKDFKLQGDIILKRADGFRLELEDRVF